jgi:hypothetical protein
MNRQYHLAGMMVGCSHDDRAAAWNARVAGEAAGRSAAAAVARACRDAGRPELVSVLLAAELTLDEALAVLAAFSRPN